MSLQDIQSSLLGLTRDELIELQKTIRLMLRRKETKDDEDWLLPSLLQEIKDRGLSFTIPQYFKIKTDKSYRGYVSKSAKVRAALSKRLPNLKLVEKYALAHLCATFLADYVEEIYGILNLDILLWNVEKIPEALDRSFPGYLQSGLLHVILRPSNPKSVLSLSET